MAIHAYTTQAGRVNEIKGEILAHAEPVEVLALGCTMKKMPKNAGDNISYRRWLPYGATSGQNTQNRPSVSAVAHLLSEGVTPTADTMTPVDVNVVILQYGCLYSYTDKTAELYEDDVPAEMKIQTGERVALLREMIRFGALKAATNAIYAGGTTRATVDETISLNNLRQMAKTLLANHAKMKTRILAPGPNYDTKAVEAGFVVFAHTDMEPDIRDLPGFTPVAKYANRQPISPYEIGMVERFRFIGSPELAPYLAGGATSSGTGMVSAGASKVDVYPMIVCAEDAAFDIALRGADSLKVNHLPHTHVDKSDMLGQRGYIGTAFWSAVLVTNHGWMGVIESGATDLAES